MLFPSLSRILLFELFVPFLLESLANGFKVFWFELVEFKMFWLFTKLCLFDCSIDWFWDLLIVLEESFLFGKSVFWVLLLLLNKSWLFIPLWLLNESCLFWFWLTLFELVREFCLFIFLFKELISCCFNKWRSCLLKLVTLELLS
jgi:hypothetical protein